ncbi:hypothetical protein [Rudaeicoccus suwonensis]|uniref:EamA-like transporter family protein n=1 Tax=Rudaeicoccus suwonensis TaxID=657409 RepID=A0A561DX73_9MICO|nr:hypothetical protein [Rudaeicoccus suwonensis]TWE07971.1 hypothetical protein BKA23_3338 [Rudaeicoccus suwonensis]
MIGPLGAIIAALAYGAATILQAMGVRRMAQQPADTTLLQRLMAGRLYAVGLALDGLGFVASFAALRTLPLFLVESMLASSVAVTAILAVWLLGVRLSRREIIALAVVGAGLVMLAVSAHEGHGKHLGHRGNWGLVIESLVVGVILAVGCLDKTPGRSSLTLAVASGLGFGITGIAARVLAFADPWWKTVTHPALLAMAIAGVFAIVAYGFALERGRTTSVAAITFAVETVLPALIGLVFLGDKVRHHFGPVAVVGFVVTLAGCLALARRAEVDDDATT